MTTWIVQTEIDSGQKFENTFEGVKQSGLLTHPRSYPIDRATTFAKHVLSEGFIFYGHVVKTFYPPHRIQEVNMYAKEE